MRKIVLRFALSLCLCLTFNFITLQTFNCSAQGVGINTTGNPANTKALLDIDATGMNPKAGLLIPRMTTTERDAITVPVPESLLIFNTTTRCYQGYNAITLLWENILCMLCPVPSSVTATESPNPVCDGGTLTLTGGATGATTWSWTGPNGFTSSLQSPTIAGITSADAGIYTLTAGNICGSAAPVSTASVIVNTNSTDPTGAIASVNPTCTSGATNLTVSGGSLGTGASWKWYTGSCGGTLVGTGSLLAVSPTTTTQYWVRAEGTCNTSACATVMVTVSATPTTANAGTDISPACGVTTATLAGNDPGVGTGLWSVVSGTATITNNTLYNSGVTGLAIPGTATLRWTISNSPCADSFDEVMITTTSCCPNAFSFTNQNGVAVNSTITSNTVTLTGGGSNMIVTAGPGCTGISINGGAFVAGPTTANSGDNIAIQLTSSASNNTTVTATVSVNCTTSGIWSVTTRPITTQTFWASTTWTRPANVTRVDVVVVGGGGGSGSGTAGGGGGGYCNSTGINVIAVPTIAVTVGTGGSPDSDGGSSIFGAYCTATGGRSGSSGGAAGSGSTANGGAACCGGGGNGPTGVSGGSGAGGSSGGCHNTSGAGGGGGIAGATGGNAGDPGSNGGPGGGGGGGGRNCWCSCGSLPGGSGGVGVVIVTEY